MRQTEVFEMVSLPKKRSNGFSEAKPIFQKKELTDKQKSWLKSHDESNWLDFALNQEYTNTKGITKTITWRLPGTEPKKDSCGVWITKGCDNVFGHPQNKPFVRHSKRSCFRASCEYCWLEKWLARESHRATQRIENYIDVFKNLQFARNPTVYKMGKNGKPTKKIVLKGMQRKYLKPIHVIVSPSWKDKFMPFDKLKDKARSMISEAGIEGGLMIYHPGGLDKRTNQWVVRPHFHIVGFGWVVNTVKISNKEGWVIKNKGLRDSLHSTIYYQLSHAGVSDGVHSITWFGSLGYSAKYSSLFKVDEEDESSFCDYCGLMLVEFEYVGQDRPPDFEFVGLVDRKDWKALETLDEALNKRDLLTLYRKTKNPRTGYINDGQGIGDNYAKFVNRFEENKNNNQIILSLSSGSPLRKDPREKLNIKTYSNRNQSNLSLEEAGLL